MYRPVGTKDAVATTSRLPQWKASRSIVPSTSMHQAQSAKNFRTGS
jgi:hypothetical protein